MTCLKSKTVKIKKEHQCYSCFRKFPIGTKMNYWAGIYEGDFCASYSCMTCVEIMNMSSDVDFPQGFVKEMLSKGETPEEMLKKWYGMAIQIYDHKKPQ